MGRRTHAAWLLLGGILTGVTLSGCALGSWIVLNGREKTRTEIQQQSYRHQATRIELDIENGDVSVAAGVAGQVSVDRRLEWSGSRPMVEENWQGDTLHVHTRCPNVGLRQLGGNQCSTAYALRVPAGVAVEMTVHQGAIRVNDIQGELRLSTLSGSLDITNAPGRIWARSDTGSITATGLRCPEADVKAYQGDVNLRFAAPPELVKAATIMGNVEVAVPPPGAGQDGYQVRAEVTDGKRNIGVPNDANARHQVFATTDMGEVNVRYAGA
jgi:hypothetical protein